MAMTNQMTAIIHQMKNRIIKERRDVRVEGHFSQNDKGLSVIGCFPSLIFCLVWNAQIQIEWYFFSSISTSKPFLASAFLYISLLLRAHHQIRFVNAIPTQTRNMITMRMFVSFIFVLEKNANSTVRRPTFVAQPIPISSHESLCS